MALRKHAERIKSRAIKRCGILLEQIEPSKGGDPSLFIAHTGTDTSVTRTQAATNAGLTKRQKDTALRVAKVDDAEFEAAVESDNPPTVTTIPASRCSPASHRIHRPCLALNRTCKAL